MQLNDWISAIDGLGVEGNNNENLVEWDFYRMKETLFSLAIESLDQCVDALMDGISAMMLSTDRHTTTVKTLLNRIL